MFRERLSGTAFVTVWNSRFSSGYEGQRRWENVQFSFQAAASRSCSKFASVGVPLRKSRADQSRSEQTRPDQSRAELSRDATDTTTRAATGRH